MTDPVRVSVVMPLFNAARTVAASIRSALDSQLRELEVVVVDDGSTDVSAQIVHSLADSRVRLFRQPASGGASRPRNVGISHARAPYIHFLDADDLLRPDKLSAALAALEQHPAAGFAFGEFEQIDAEGRVLDEAAVVRDKMAECALARTPLADGWSLITQPELARGFLYRNFISPSGVTVRKSVLAAVGGFDESLVYSEDLDLWFRLAHHSSALYRDAVGHSYRVAPGSLTFRPSVRTARDRITVLQRERARRATRAERRQLNRLLAETQATMGWEYRRNRRRLQAAVAFAHALVRQPQARFARAFLS